jgi:hypothetical protein
MSFEDKQHVCSDCYIIATKTERERIIKLLEDYSDGEMLVLVFSEIAALIKGENK